LVVRDVATRVNTLVLQSENLDLDTMIVFTTYGYYDFNWSQRWLSTLMDARTTGEGIDRAQRNQWRQEFMHQFGEKVRWEGNDPSKFAALHSYFISTGSLNWWHTNESYYCRQLIFAGRFAIVDGEPDMGKSDLAFRMSEIMCKAWEEYVSEKKNSNLWRMVREQLSEYDSLRGQEGGGTKSHALGLHLARGFRVLSNNQVSGKHRFAKYYQFATRLSDVIIQMCENAKQGIFTLVILDEMGISFNKRRSMSRENAAIDGIFRLIRKFNASVILITQNKDLDLPPNLTRKDRGAKTIVEKKSRTQAIITIASVPHLQGVRVRDIPPTTLTFDTRSAAALAVDMNPRLLVEAIELEKAMEQAAGKIWGHNDMYDAIIRWCRTYRVQPSGAQTIGADGKPAAPTLVQHQRITQMLHEINPISGERYTEEDIAESTGESIEAIEKVRDSLLAAPMPDYQADGAHRQRVEKLLATHSDEEIQGLTQYPLSFIQQIRALKAGPIKSETEQKAA
jgi:hypothetical protein